MSILSTAMRLSMLSTAMRLSMLSTLHFRSVVQKSHPKTAHVQNQLVRAKIISTKDSGF